MCSVWIFRLQGKGEQCDLEDSVREACDGCPVQAISIEE